MNITSVNSTFMLSIAGLFATPQALKGYATDDAITADEVEMAEVTLGVDGRMSAGFVPFLTKMGIMLQADSPSIVTFDTWLGAQASTRDLYQATGVIYLPATKKVYTCTQGVLTGGKLLPDVKKVLGPQKYSITWGSVVATSV
jgi:tail fiber protein gp32